MYCSGTSTDTEYWFQTIGSFLSQSIWEKNTQNPKIQPFKNLEMCISLTSNGALLEFMKLAFNEAQH